MNTGTVTLIIVILVILGFGVMIFINNPEFKKSACGTHTETYTSTQTACDGITGCRCLHKSWLGMGSCDSCSCTKEVSNC